MAASSRSLGIPRKESLRQRVNYTQSQRTILQEWYERNPYPDAGILNQLAETIDVPVPKIKNWFSNHRMKQKILEQDHSEVRPHQLSFTRAQEDFLSKAFKKNRLPDRATRTKMAIRLGIKEAKIQDINRPKYSFTTVQSGEPAWFQKQRYLNPEHREESSNLSDGTNEGPNPAAQQQNIDLATPTANCFPSSEPCCNVQTSLPAPLESRGLVPGDSFGVSGSQVSSTITLQATETVQEEQNLDAPLTSMNPLPEEPSPGQDFSGTQAPFCSQPDTEHEKQQSEDPDYTDISYIMQWWDKGRLDLIANWDPQKEA
ncbi:double homeobox protein B [Peromyscus californicus insignis]|uniref:double homeobox protein B n=1 Tax=Peromyscus californicus insignis TaxID=564181 RepID=UPI0022A70106|nr:double homeobox protein B [Peromyscus californicus insignis]